MKPILSPAPRELLLEYARSNVLIGLDFDGTLAPIVADPDTARMRPRTRALLAAVAARYPVVVVSGRAQPDVAARVGGIPLRAIVGNHGLEPTASPGIYEQIVKRWRAPLTRFVADHPGTELEDKVFSLALHTRRCRTKKRALKDLEAVVAQLGPVRVVGGKEVVNLLPVDAPHKGLAVERLRQRLGCDTVVYVGDDETDEDVFAMEKPLRLLGIRVERAAATTAPFHLRDQREMDALLRTLQDARPEPEMGAVG